MIAENATLHVIFLAVYLVVLLGVGALKARKVKNQEDFSLAGRGLPTAILVGTLLATWIGTGSIFGNAEKTYEIGLGAFLIPIGSVGGIMVLFAIAGRIRKFGQFTIQDILEARFGALTRVLATLTLVSAYLIIVSYQYRAGAAVLGYLFPEVSTDTLLVAVAGFVILYTALAGMYSVAYTDVANGVLMVLGIGVAIPIVLAKTGSWNNMLAAMPGKFKEPMGHWQLLGLISATLPAFLLILGDANIVQRFFSAKNPKSARKAVLGLLIGVVVLELAIIFLAFISRGLIYQYKLEPPAEASHIIVHVAFHVLPPFLGAMLVATVVAVVVSTADSYLLSPATSLVRDVYQRFINPKASDHNMVLTGRLIVVGLGLTALWLATLSKEFFTVALFAYTIYGAGITPVILAAYFWPRANQPGALASMLSGVGMAFFWRHITQESFFMADSGALGSLRSLGQWASQQGIDAVIPSILVALPVLVLVSLATKAPDQGHMRAF